MLGCLSPSDYCFSFPLLFISSCGFYRSVFAGKFCIMLYFDRVVSQLFIAYYVEQACQVSWKIKIAIKRFVITFLVMIVSS